jgi:hypothetical protein
VSTIPVDSEGILRWDQCHWKLYEIMVATIYRTSKSDSVCGQGISFGEVRFWNPKWNRSRVGRGLLLSVDVLLLLLESLAFSKSLLVLSIVLNQ